MKKIATSILSILMAVTLLFSSALIAQAQGYDVFDPLAIEMDGSQKLSFSSTRQTYFLKFTPTATKMYEFNMNVRNADYDYDIQVTDAQLEPVADGYCNGAGDFMAAAATLKAGASYLIKVSYYESASVSVTLNVVEHKHTVMRESVQASTSEDGYDLYDCAYCDEMPGSSYQFYSSIASVTLSSSKYTYNGKAKKPSVKVLDFFGDTVPSSQYTVKYSGARKNVGTYTVTVTFKNHYKGTVKKSFVINPKGTSVSKASSPKSKQIKVSWKKQTTQTSGYQIQYSTSSKFTKNTTKTVTVKGAKNTSKTISKLKGKKKYYVRVRTYKVVNKKNYYSAWSKAKSVTTKK